MAEWVIGSEGAMKAEGADGFEGLEGVYWV